MRLGELRRKVKAYDKRGFEVCGKRKRIGRWKNRKVDMTLCHIGLSHVRCVTGKA